MTATAMPSTVPTLLQADGLSKRYGSRWACRGVSLDLCAGEVLAVVGESGSGKTTLLQLLAGRLAADEGQVRVRCDADGDPLVDIARLPAAELRRLSRTEWGFVEQRARDGLRMGVSAGANVGERLMSDGVRHYGQLRTTALQWLERVELDPTRIDDLPSKWSGGMQQRLQIARQLVTHPRLVFMDEPTTGLDVSVQARVLDLLRRLVDELDLAAVIVTHDLAVARLLADRLLVMKDGRVVEQGLADRVLDDPQHPYTQQLVASVLTP